MTVFRTCRSCAHSSDCTIQHSIKGAIKGLRVTSLKHSCKSYEDRYAIGQPVWALVQHRPATDGDNYYCRAPGKDWYPGFFVAVARSNLRAIVFILQGVRGRSGDETFEPWRESGRGGVCKLPWDRIEPRGGPRLTACSQCGQLPGMKCEGPEAWPGSDFECPAGNQS